MIYSFEANLFGPGTQHRKGNLLESALTIYRQSGRQSAFLVSEIIGDSIFISADESVPLDQISKLPAVFIFRDLNEMDVLTKRHPALADKFLSLEEIDITDYFDGRSEAHRNVATNFPLLRSDWQRSAVFSTDHLSVVPEITGPGDYLAVVGREHIVSAADVVYRDPAQPLYQNGRTLACSAEPFGTWPEVDVNKAPPAREISEPVLYLAHPFSSNYNIFLHETIPVVLEIDRLPPATRFFVRNTDFRIDFLTRLGVPMDRIILASAEAILFKHVLIPIRRLNLKYLGATLFDTYSRVSESLQHEGDAPRVARGMVYLDRKRITQNSGANRFVLNDEELVNALAERSVGQVFLEDLTLLGKFNALSNCDTVLTSIGANLVNVAFSKNIRRIILITTPLWGHFLLYWTRLLQMRHPHAEIVIFNNCTIEDNGLSGDPFNKPYRVDVRALMETL